MPFAVEITARALREIDETLGWLADRSPGSATRWYQRLMTAVVSLERNPERFGEAPEAEWYPGLRQMLYGKRRGIYRILYVVRDNTAYILRVRHSARALLKPGDFDFRPPS